MLMRCFERIMRYFERLVRYVERLMRYFERMTRKSDRCQDLLFLCLLLLCHANEVCEVVVLTFLIPQGRLQLLDLFLKEDNFHLLHLFI